MLSFVGRLSSSQRFKTYYCNGTLKSVLYREVVSGSFIRGSTIVETLNADIIILVSKHASQNVSVL